MLTTSKEIGTVKSLKIVNSTWGGMLIKSYLLLKDAKGLTPQDFNAGLFEHA